jgi:hypothetical protein
MFVCLSARAQLGEDVPLHVIKWPTIIAQMPPVSLHLVLFTFDQAFSFNSGACFDVEAYG